MIGILTFQDTNNFGAHLHTIALYRKLKQLGYDSEIIDYLSPDIQRKETQMFRNLGFSLRRWLIYLLYGRKTEKKYKILQSELRKYTRVSRLYTPADIAESNDSYDTFLVGSDVVWSLNISNYDYNFFLKFAKPEKKKIAFSSSVGETDLYRDDPHLPALLKAFSHIAVRDEDAVGWVNDIAGMKADYVCDPTMLFTAQQWDEIICPKHYESDYVLVYFFTRDKMYDDILSYAKAHGLKVKIIHTGRPIKGMESVWANTHAEFLGLIKNCKALFTGSYHGMLFGLYYHREVFYYNRGLKARMASLSSMLELDDHNGDAAADVNAVQPIDYSKVENKIGEFRSKSENILQQMLQEK